MADSVTLRADDSEVELPIVQATLGASGIDVGGLLARTGMVTYDNGLANTSTVRSAITFVDGDKGVLLYRGYPIEELARQSEFLEVSYLLIYGELPTARELGEFRRHVARHTLLHEEMKRFFEGFPRDAHPMATLASAACTLSTFYQDSLNPHDPNQVEISIWRLLAKLPTIAAFAYKKSIGQAFMYPRNDLSYVENFLYMMFAVRSEAYHVDPVTAEALNLLLILHADHEQNCSTSTVRLVGSSDANLFGSISAGICALWGPLHGGANQSVLEMLMQIHRDGGDVASAVKRAQDPDDSFRLMGFGHRVYKNFDPRATILKESADRVLSKLGRRDPLLDIARRLEEVALADPYFVDRRLYPNVDFYSGIIYRAIGFPVNMMTVLFALGRLPGWIGHWKEQAEAADARIGRPRQVYTGATQRPLVPIQQRG